MNIVIAPDKFKGTLSAARVCLAITEALYDIHPDWNIISIPVADGGEGTAELLTAASHGKEIRVTVMDPLFREIQSGYGISEDGKSGFIEMARASGLELLQKNERNPLYTSTFGTGQLILDALQHGVSQVVLGIGGSATNDAGMGMAEALGYSFYDKAGNKLKPIGENLVKLHAIDSTHAHERIADTKFTVLCDVNNPLYGEMGAAHIFGPQKGADAQIIRLLDEGLRRFAEVAQSSLHTLADFPGAGAAGGTGSGAKVFLKAHISGGFDFISGFTQLREKIAQANLVITGEGKMDSQSLSGKVIGGVARIAAANHKKCMAFTGKSELSPSQIQKIGLHQVVTLVNSETTEQDAMANAFDLLKIRTMEVFG
ncbi:MAG TPA: glycerate kinase [Cyclobacteriaceae bacterium]|nr:glycerate kinase [Cyclobacteriaceae bacterium]